MARLVYGMNVSLDGYVDHDHAAFSPDPVLFRHYVDQTRGLSGSLYGRGLYELMHYWDDDQDGWSPDEEAFAEAWRSVPKWVVSRSLTELGPNATLVRGDLATEVRRLKDEVEGEIEVGGPVLAQTLTELGLIDRYVLYMHPVALGSGRPFFTGPSPRLRLVDSDRIGPDVIRLRYVPA